MILTKLHIDGFGKHTDLTLTFEEGINKMEHPNEWGKSTVLAFIRAAFYGLEGRSADNERRRYTPWSGGAFGGELHFTHQNTPYCIFCSFGQSKRQDRVRLFSDVTGRELPLPANQSLGEYFWGLTAGAFDSSVSVRQLRSVIEKNDDKEGFLLSKLSALTGQGDEETSVREVDRRLKAALDSISAPRGKNGLLDKLLVQKEVLEKELRQMEEQESAREELEQKKKQLEALLSQKNDTLLSLSDAMKRQQVKYALDKKKQLLERSVNIDLLQEKQQTLKERDIPYSKNKFGLLFLLSGLIVFSAGAVCLWQNKMLFGIVCCIAGFLAGGIGILLKKQYQSAAATRKEALAELQYALEKEEALFDQALDGKTLAHWESAWQEAELHPEAKLFNTAYFTEDLPLRSEEIRSLIQRTSSELSYTQASLDSLYRTQHGISYDSAQEELQELRQEQQRLQKEFDALSVAKDEMASAFEELRNTFAPLLSHETSSILSEITDNQHVQVKIDEAFAVSVWDRTADTLPHDSVFYSGAAVDQIYFSLRLALSRLIVPSEEPLPLLLDDPFVQYDESRRKKALDFLEHYSSSNHIQVVLMQTRS